MAESMSEQIFSIACALSKADESEKSMLRMICTAQEESLVRALKESVAKEDCESALSARRRGWRRPRWRARERVGRSFPPCARAT